MYSSGFTQQWVKNIQIISSFMCFQTNCESLHLSRSLNQLSASPLNPLQCPWLYSLTQCADSGHPKQCFSVCVCECRKGRCMRGQFRGQYFSTWQSCVRSTLCTCTYAVESGFSASSKSPRGDEENTALLRGGMQTKKRGRRRKGRRKGREGREGECVWSLPVT